MLPALCLVLGASLSPGGALPQDDYLGRFERAMAAFDRGAYAEAATGFEGAGELAPDAPVWRVHRAVALLRSGALDDARALAVEALRRGYPVSDLAAIDARLVPDGELVADLAHGKGFTVVTVERALLHDARERVDLRDDVAIVDDQAFDLTNGRLIATRLPLKQRVVARFRKAGGEWQELIEPEKPGWWKHVDGRLLEEPATAGGPKGLRAAIKRLPASSVLRGLRCGFWVPGDAPDGLARFRDGSVVTWSPPAWSFRPPPDDLDLVLDPDTLALHELDRERWEDPNRVLEPEDRARISRLLEPPLGERDAVWRFNDLDPWIVFRSVEFGEIARGRAPMTIVDVEAGEVVAEPQLATHGLEGIHAGRCALSPDGAMLLVSNGVGSTLEAISTATWTNRWREPWRSGTGAPRTIRIEGDRVFSYTGSPAHTQVHDVATGEVLLDGESLALRSVDGSKNGRWIVGSCRGSTLLFDAERIDPIVDVWIDDRSNRPPRTVAVGVDGTFLAPASQIRKAHVSIGGRFVTAARVAPWLWDPLHVRSLRDDADRSARAVAEPPRFGRAYDVAIADDEPIIAALGMSGVLHIMDATDGVILATSPELFPRGCNLDISPDGASVALLTRDQSVFLWHWREEGPPQEVTELDVEPTWGWWPFGSHVSFSPDGERILVANHRSERVLLDRSGGVVARIPRRSAVVELDTDGEWRHICYSVLTEPVAWSADGMRLALVTEGRPVMIDARTGAPLDLKLEEMEPTAECVALDPEGRLLAAGHFRGLVVAWDLTTGEKRWVHEYADPLLGPHDDTSNSVGIGHLAFSRDGSRLAGTSVMGIHAFLLDTRSGERAWIGPHSGGRMGEPADITWATGGEAFYFAYVSGGMGVQRVELPGEPKEDDEEEGRAAREDALRNEPQQHALGRGSPVDVGWNDLAVHVSEGEVVVRQAASGDVVWRSDG